jgi:hypothetical protein
MAELLVERGGLVELVELPVDLHALEALLAQLEEFLAVFALPVAHDGGQQVGARPLLHRHDAVDHVLDLLRLDGQASGGGIGRAGAGEEKAEVVVDLRHRADGGAGVFRRGLLFDGDGGAEAGDVVHVRLFHHVEELARIGREAFDIAPLAFGIDRVEGEGRLARTRQPRDHHQLVAGDVEVDILEVMLARAAHLDGLKLRHAVRSPLTAPATTPDSAMAWMAT